MASLVHQMDDSITHVKSMMKNYQLYLFTQPGSEPCDRVSKHIQHLTPAERAEVDFVPLNVANGERSALAEELSVELTPTLVVTHETVTCDLDWDTNDEYCELEEESVERFVGAKSIIQHLYATIDAYTYAHPE